MKRNQSFQSSLNKLDQLIGVPPPTIYSKNALRGSKISMPQLNSSFSNAKKHGLKRVNTTLNLTANNLFSRLKPLSPIITDTYGLRIEELKQIYICKCKDLGIPSVPKLEKRFFEFIDKILKDRTMNFSDNRLGYYSAEVIGKILSNNTYFCNLNLSKNNFGDKGIVTIIKYLKKNKTIIHIDISSNDIKSEGANIFFTKLKHHESIVSIDICSHEGLNKNRFGPVGVAPVRELLSENNILIFLNLSDTFIGAEGLRYVIEGLQENKSLKYLNLSKNNLGGKIIKELLDSVKKSQLLSLNLSANRISNEGSEAIGDFLFAQVEKNTTLKILDISNNEITHKGSGRIFSGLKENSILEELNIENNSLSEISGNWIQYCFVNNTILDVLNLSQCLLTESGAQKIFEGLPKNTTLRTLILKENHIGDQGAIMFAECLDNDCYLSTIDLSNNQIGKIGVVSIFTALKKNTYLNAIYLRDNLIKDDCMQLVIDVIRNKPSLQTVKLENTQVGMRYMNQVNSYLEKNKIICKAQYADRLKTQIFELSLKDFHIDRIKQTIIEKKKEQEDIAMGLDFHRNNLEEIRAELNLQFAKIEEEYTQYLNNRENLSEMLADLEYNIALESKKHQNEVNKMVYKITEIERETELLEYRSN